MDISRISETLDNFKVRISDIVVYSKYKKIRCKIDGVQQMGQTLSLEEQRKVKQLVKENNSQELNKMKFVLAEKYFKQTLNELDESMRHNNGFKI